MIKKLKKLGILYPDYSHQPIMFSSLCSLVMLIICTISWFACGDAPLDIFQYVLMAHVGCYLGYCGKMAYEYKKTCELEKEVRRYEEY